MVLIPALDGPHRRLNAQVRHILDQIWNVLLANLGCAVIYVFASWGSIEHSRLLTWFGALLFVTAARAAYHYSLLRQGEDYLKAHANQIMRNISIGIAASAGLWGLIGSALLHSPDPFAIMVSTFIIAGLSGGAVASYSVSPRLLYGFLFLIISPLIFRLAAEPEPHFKLLAALAGLYLILLSVSARHVSRHNMESIDMTLANQDLIRKLNDASHEVRTPVAAITGFAEALKERSDLVPAHRDFVDIIYRNSVYLGRLVDNLFLMAKAEAGELAGEDETFNLIDNIQLAVELVRRKAEEKGLSVVIDLALEIPPFVKSNPIKLQQVLINLLTNGIKFTKEGEVRLSVEKLEDDRLRIVVADTGIGIPEEARTLVFEPFWRENRREVKLEEGAGLGLALSRRLVVSMGGDLRLVSSKVGEGSVFELTLPVLWFQSREPTPLDASHESRFNGKKVLFADDSADLRSLYSYRFMQAGATVETVNDGAAAVAKVLAGNVYDLIVLDLNMPGLDGYQAAAQIRSRGIKAPIVALTASADCPIEQEKCRAAGFNALIRKSTPVTKIVDMAAGYV